MVVNVLGTEATGELLTEEAIEIIAGVAQLFVVCVEHLIVGEPQRTHQPWHLFGLERTPFLISHEEQFAFAMVDDVLHLRRMKFMKNGHSHCSVGECSEKGHAPTGAVLATQCHTITLLQPTLLKKDM